MLQIRRVPAQRFGVGIGAPPHRSKEKKKKKKNNKCQSLDVKDATCATLLRFAFPHYPKENLKSQGQLCAE
jgi:hypothetical protein